MVRLLLNLIVPVAFSVFVGFLVLLHRQTKIKVGLNRFKCHLFLFLAVRLEHKTYLSKRDSAILVLVHLVNDLIDLLLGDVETSALNDSLKFISGDATIAVEVEGVECVVDVEVWVGAELLAHRLSLVLSSKVGSPACSELVSGSCSEAVITSVDWGSVVGWSSSDLTGVVIVEGQESCLEFGSGESAVSAGVVPSDEEIDLVLGWEETDSVESVSELEGIDDTIASLVEDFEGISEVEVIACSKTGLVGLNLVLDSADGLKAADELVFVSD